MRTVERLIELHAKSGGVMTGQAAYVCPRCLIAPMLFEGNRDWNNGAPVVECLCLAPFSPKEGYQVAVAFNPWAFFPTPESWEEFVKWKLTLPVPGDEEDEDDDNEVPEI